MEANEIERINYKIEGRKPLTIRVNPKEEYYVLDIVKQKIFPIYIVAGSLYGTKTMYTSLTGLTSVYKIQETRHLIIIGYYNYDNLMYQLVDTSMSTKAMITRNYKIVSPEKPDKLIIKSNYGYIISDLKKGEGGCWDVSKYQLDLLLFGNREGDYSSYDFKMYNYDDQYNKMQPITSTVRVTGDYKGLDLKRLVSPYY